MQPSPHLDLETEPLGATVLLVCSPGGQVLRLRRLRAWWEMYDRAWVSFRRIDSESMLAGERVIWAPDSHIREPLAGLWRNLRLAWRTIRAERPSVVVSSGAGLAIPFFIVARLHGARTVYVESHRLDGPSRAGRICYRLSDLFVVQWKEQRRYYPKGELVGCLL